MIHTPMLSTDLFEDFAATRILSDAREAEPFNLLKFLYLRGEHQTLVDVYDACHGLTTTESTHLSGKSRKLRSDVADQNSREIEELVYLHKSFAIPLEEDSYWAGFGFYAVGQHEKAQKTFEQAYKAGYQAAAAPLAALAHEVGDLEKANFLLNSLELFDELKPWDRALAYRERGKLLGDAGNFISSLEAHKTSWDLLRKIPNGHIILGFSGQLLAWSLELLSRSTEALEIIREAKKFTRSDRRVQLLYLQVLTAVHVDELEEAHEALEELKTFVPNNPHLQGLASNAAGELARFERDYKEAIQHFENAVVASSGAHTEAAFSANLFACACALASKDLQKAVLYLERAKEEFLVIEPFLTSAYAKRARAGLLLRQGTLDIHFGKETAVQHLRNALRLYKELGLPLGQAQALLQLAEWFARPADELLPDEDWEPRDAEQATWLVQQAHDLRKSFQDAASYRAELDLVPDARRFYMAAVAGSGISQTSLDMEKIFAEIFGVIRTSSEPKPDLLFADLRRLVFSGAHEDAVQVFERVFLPKPATRAWGGLAWLLVHNQERAYECWETSSLKSKAGQSKGDPSQDNSAELETSYKTSFPLMQSLARSIEHARTAPVQLHPFGKPELFFVKDEGTRGLSYERLGCAISKSYELFAMLIEGHPNGNGFTAEEIFGLIWTNVPADRAAEEFAEACREINTLGKRPLLLNFAIVRGDDERYRLMRTGIHLLSMRGLRELSALPIGYWPLEFELRIGSCELSFAWALSEYKTFFDGTTSAWALRRRGELELRLLERGRRLIQQLKGEGDEDAARLLALKLSTLKVEGLQKLWTEAKEEVECLAAELSNESHLLPGELRVYAKNSFKSDEELETLQKDLQRLGWYVVCEDLNKKMIKPRIKRSLGALACFDQSTMEGILELFSARLIQEKNLDGVLAELRHLLLKHGISELHTAKQLRA